jgi:hypothetical protein
MEVYHPTHPLPLRPPCRTPAVSSQDLEISCRPETDAEAEAEVQEKGREGNGPIGLCRVLLAGMTHQTSHGADGSFAEGEGGVTQRR